MARIVLNQNENFRLRGDAGGNTYAGRPGGEEALFLEAGARNARTNADIDRISTPLSLDAHAFTATDDGLRIAAVGGDTLVTLPSLNGPLDLRTTTGNITLRQTGAREFTAINPTNPADAAVIGADPVTPDIGTGVLSSIPDIGRAPTFDVRDNAPVAEGEQARFVIDATPPAREAVTLDYAVSLEGGASDADIGAITVDGQPAAGRSGTLTFAPGESEQTLAVQTTPDTERGEDGEAIGVALADISGGGAVLGRAETTVAIDDGPLAFELTQASEKAFEGEMVTYEVTAPAPVAADTEVTVRVLPADPTGPDQGTRRTNLNDFRAGQFNPVSTTIPAGETTATVAVGTQKDTITELPETFEVEASVADQSIRVTSTLLDGAESGRIFSFTPGTDRFGPTSVDPADEPTKGNDTFRATADGDFTSDDVIKAGGGDDMVDAILAPDGVDDVLAPVMEGVETVRLDATDPDTFSADDVVFDAGDTEGLSSVRIDNLGDGDPFGTDTDTATVRDIPGDVTAIFANANDTGGGSAATVDVRAPDDDGQPAPSATIALVEAALGDGTQNTTGLTVNDVTTVTLMARGTASSRIDDLIADAADELVVGGSQRLTIGNALANDAGDIADITIDGTASLTTGALGQDLSVTAADGADTIDAGAITSDVSARLGGGDDELTLGAGSDTVSGGAGADAIVIGGGKDIVDAGPGNDTVTVAGNLTADDSIDGGKGADAIIAGGGAISSYAGNDETLAALTGIEGIGLSDASSNLTGNAVDLRAFGTAGQRFVVASGGQIDTATTVGGLGDGATVATQGAAAFGAALTLNVTGAQAAGARDDAVTFRHATALPVIGVNDVRLDVPGINALTLESNADAPSASDGMNLILGDAAGLERLTVTGNGTTQLDVVNAPSLTALGTVDAAEAAGALDLDLGGGSFAGGEGVVVTGGANDDIIIGTAFTDELTTGEGDDTVAYDDNSFGAADRITDFESGADRLLIDLTGNAGNTTVATTANNSVAASGGATTVGAFLGGSTVGVLTTGSGRVSLNSAASTVLSTATTAVTQPLTNANQLFTASSLAALRARVTEAAAANASAASSAGAVAFGFTGSASRVFVFRFTDTTGSAANGAADLTTVTNTIATIGSGTIAADDIAVF